LGCKYLIVVHDLDRRNRSDLHAELERAVSGSPIPRKLIVIPVEEIEAWLLSDEVTISRFFNLRKGLKKVSNPESVLKPKERLARLVYQSTGGKKRYVNTIHNEGIARKLSLNKLRICASFVPLETFVATQIC